MSQNKQAVIRYDAGPQSYFWLIRSDTPAMLSVVHREGCHVLAKQTGAVFLGTLYGARQAVQVARLRYGLESLPCVHCLSGHGLKQDSRLR